jgi:hypothetical protein
VSTLLFGMLLGSALGLPAAVRGSLDLADRTEVRVRDSGLATDPALDAINQPGFQLGLETHRSRWDFGYSARYTLLNMRLEVKPTILSEAYVRASWLASRRTRLTLTQDGSWGQQSFVALAVVPAAPSEGAQGAGAPAAGAATVPRIDTVPRVASFGYVFWRPSLMSTTALSHRWVLDTTVQYTVDGGSDAQARNMLPLRWGPSFEAQASYLLSRRGRLLSTATASRTVFSSGPETILVAAAEGIRRTITRRTEAQLEVGAAAVWFKPESNMRNQVTPFPTAAFIINHRHALERDAVLGIDVTGGVGPLVQRLTGHVAQRLQATAAVSFTENRLLMRIEAGVAETLPRDDPQSFRIVYGSANLGYGFGKFVLVDTGVRYTWQEQLAFGQLPPQRLVYVGLTLREPTLRF